MVRPRPIPAKKVPRDPIAREPVPVARPAVAPTPAPLPDRLARRGNTGKRYTNNHIDNEVRNEAALRWLTCHTLMNYALGERVSYAKLGTMLAAEFPWRKRPYDQAVTYRISTGERAIRLEDVIAFVHVLRRHGVHVDPGWLAFGAECSAPGPDPELVENARRALATD